MIVLGVLCSVIIAMVMVSYPSAADAQQTKTKQKCENWYEAFRNLGEKKFIEKYRSTSIITDCVKLYKDPSWYFAGKSKIDKFYDQKLILENAKSKQPQVDILWKKIAGNGKYLVNYKICAKDQYVSQPTVLLSSRVEEFVAVSYKSISSNTCKTFQAQIKSHSSNDIAIKYVQSIKDPAMKAAKIVNLEKK